MGVLCAPGSPPACHWDRHRKQAGCVCVCVWNSAMAVGSAGAAVLHARLMYVYVWLMLSFLLLLLLLCEAVQVATFKHSLSARACGSPCLE